ncbi:hypothetical protein OUZ56_020683 [Daphnia magna]|uniref:Uncharacterized protein n=1 Tax=Daphnia magna TaxID=35525 RepID=A0ABQ9ZF55_9CRUS|nr:hypothetical protein OUZ56_020683 [Daphnia magna]
MRVVLPKWMNRVVNHIARWRESDFKRAGAAVDISKQILWQEKLFVEQSNALVVLPDFQTTHCHHSTRELPRKRYLYLPLMLLSLFVLGQYGFVVMPADKNRPATILLNAN